MGSMRSVYSGCAGTAASPSLAIIGVSIQLSECSSYCLGSRCASFPVPCYTNSSCFHRPLLSASLTKQGGAVRGSDPTSNARTVSPGRTLKPIWAHLCFCSPSRFTILHCLINPMPKNNSFTFCLVV